MPAMEEKYGPKLAMYVCYVSSEDEVRPVSALRNQIRSSSGWQSNKHCTYPQELGFRFDGVVSLDFVRILCHERKIPSCIDVAVAQATDSEVESGICDSYAESKFSRLGHVRLSTNEVSQYMARELKAISVKRRCKYLKLVLRKPHHNTYNLFNQVGIVALTAHGTLIRSFNAWTDLEISIPVGVVAMTPLEEMLPPPVTVITGSAGEEHRSIMSKRAELEQLKKRAVAEEDYDLAAALKKQIELLQSSSDELERLQQQKADAVAAEDYSRAKELKARIEALRNRAFSSETQNANPPTLCVPRPTTAAPTTVATPPASPPPVRVSRPATVGVAKHDEVTVGGKGFYDLDAALATDSRATPRTTSGAVPTGADTVIPEAGGGERWEKTLNCSIATFITDKSQPTTLSGGLLSDSKAYEADLGVYCVACLLGRRGQLREAAIRGSFAEDGAEALASHTSSAAETFLLYLSSPGHGVGDPVAGAALASCEAIEKIVANALKGWTPVAQLQLPLTTALGEVVARMGDSNNRVRDSVENVIIRVARSSIGPDKVVPLLLADPDKRQKKPANYRVHVSRINVLSTLVDDLGVSSAPNGRALSIDALFTKVLTPSLQHSNAEVRDAAIKLFAKITVQQPSVCRPLIQQFKPAQQALIEEQVALMKHAAEPSGLGPDMEVDTVSVHSTPQAGSARHTDSDTDSATQYSNSRRPSSHGEQESQAPQSCQFCGESSPNFTGAELDMHYVRSCPMLCPCPLCDQVTEICTLQQHLITECESRRLVRECPRCHEAFRVEDFKRHTAAKACIDASPLFSVCPLCHERFKSGMNGWRAHLTTAPGCPNNPRKYDGTGPVI